VKTRVFSKRNSIIWFSLNSKNHVLKVSPWVLTRRSLVVVNTYDRSKISKPLVSLFSALCHDLRNLIYGHAGELALAINLWQSHIDKKNVHEFNFLLLCGSPVGQLTRLTMLSMRWVRRGMSERINQSALSTISNFKQCLSHNLATSATSVIAGSPQNVTEKKTSPDGEIFRLQE